MSAIMVNSQTSLLFTTDVTQLPLFKSVMMVVPILGLSVLDPILHSVFSWYDDSRFPLMIDLGYHLYTLFRRDVLC